MSLTKQYLIFLLRLLEYHSSEEQEQDHILKEIVGYFIVNPDDEDFSFVIPDKYENDEEIYGPLKENLILAEVFREDPNRIRMQDYKCSHEDINTICDAFESKRQFFLENNPIEMEPDIAQSTIYYVKFMLTPIHDNLHAQGIKFGIGKLYTKASSPDEVLG
jgi:hypothetical protein